MVSRVFKGTGCAARTKKRSVSEDIFRLLEAAAPRYEEKPVRIDENASFGINLSQNRKNSSAGIHAFVANDCGQLENLGLLQAGLLPTVSSLGPIDAN